jgi:hypothetical protein
VGNSPSRERGKDIVQHFVVVRTISESDEKSESDADGYRGHSPDHQNLQYQQDHGSLRNFGVFYPIV